MLCWVSTSPPPTPIETCVETRSPGWGDVADGVGAESASPRPVCRASRCRLLDRNNVEPT
jgi:hypothetical protein